MVDSLVTVGAQ